MHGLAKVGKHPPIVFSSPLWASDFQRFALAVLWYAMSVFGVCFWIVLFICLARLSGCIG